MDWNWSKEPNLVGLTFRLVPTADYSLNTQYQVGLHAWFLAQVQQTNPKLSQVLHDKQTEKAFTLSGLEGELLAEGKKYQNPG